MEAPRMRILALIPARGGSRRLPGKNLAKLGGKSLVRRALETALACPVLDRVGLSSEDPAIWAEAEGLRGVAVITRPPELASDDARAYDVVVHALTVLESRTERYDAVAVLQCTSPFTTVEDIEGAVALLRRSGAESVVSIVKAEHHLHPLKMKTLDGDRLVPLIEDDLMRPSHELPEVWVRNGSIYLSRRDVIEAGQLVSDDLRGFQMPRERSVDIDTELDLAFAEFLWARQERKA